MQALFKIGWLLWFCVGVATLANNGSPILAQAEQLANRKLSGWIAPHHRARIQIRPVAAAPGSVQFFPCSIKLVYRARGAEYSFELALIELNVLMKRYHASHEGVIDHIVTETFYGLNGVDHVVKRHPELAGSGSVRPSPTVFSRLRFADIESFIAAAPLTPGYRSAVYQGVIEWINHWSQRGIQIKSLTPLRAERLQYSDTARVVFAERLELDTQEFGTLRLDLISHEMGEILPAPEQAFRVLVDALEFQARYSPYRRKMLGLDSMSWTAPRDLAQTLHVEVRDVPDEMSHLEMEVVGTQAIVLKTRNAAFSSSGLYPISVLDANFSDGAWYRLSDLGTAYYFVSHNQAGGAAPFSLSTRWSSIEIWQYPYDSQARRLLRVYHRTQADQWVTSDMLFLIQSCSDLLSHSITD